MLAPRKYPEELRERATRMAVETRRALVVATGVSAQGRQEILSMALGNAETVDFWTSFLRSLRERGLKVPSPHDPEGLVPSPRLRARPSHLAPRPRGARTGHQ